MKRLILSLSLLLITNSILISQNILHQKSSEQTDYWNMAFTGGALFNLIDKVNKDNKFRTGYIGGFDLSYDMKGKKSAIVITANYGRINYTLNNYPGLNPYKEYYELTFGPRFYLGKGYFVETVFGNYLINYAYETLKPAGYEYYSNSLFEDLYTCFGTGLGAGARMKLSDDINAIFKLKTNLMFTGGKTLLFGSLNAGIVFRNKIEPEVEKRYSKNGTWSATVSGGINNPELFHSANYSIAGYAGAEVAYRSAPKFEVYGDLEYNEINKNPGYYSGRSSVDLSIGPRFLFGAEKYLSFFEAGMGFYIQDFSNTYYGDGDVPYMGVNFGAGVIININEYIGFPVRSKMHLVFNGNNKPGGYLTVSGGLRYTL